MMCPKCYSKVNKYSKRCDQCGFKMIELKEATNTEAKKALKTIYKDDVLYTTETPLDVSRKKLILFAIFLGLFGVHDFYVGKFWQGLYLCLSTSITLILTTILFVMNTVFSNIVQDIFAFSTVFQGIALVIWVADLIKIITKKYKIPVYKESFSK